MNINAIHDIDDHTALRILSALTADLQDELQESQKIGSIEDAREAIEEFLSEGGTDRKVPDHIGADQARAFLAVLAQDAATCDRVAELVADPPDDEQRSVEMALAAAVVLGGLITWLQTKFIIELTHQDGKTLFRFYARKDPTDLDLVKDVANSVTKIL